MLCTILVYSVSFMLITAAASIFTGALPGYIVFDSGSVLYLLRKCMEISLLTAIVMRDIPGVVITRPLNIPGAFLCIGVWGVASVLLAGAVLKNRK